jgi:hypothetical protein
MRFVRGRIAPDALRHMLMLTVIVALALGLRLYRLADIDIRFDAASALQQAQAIADGAWPGFARYSGSIIEHPPLFLYLLALPMLLSRAFLSVAAFHVVLDVCAIPVVYIAAVRRNWPVAAVVGALLLATNPWATQFARNLGIVTPPLFAALSLWGLLEGIGARRAWGWTLAAIAAVCGLAAHLSGIVLLAGVAICALIYRRQTHWRGLAAGVLLPLALLALLYFVANGTAVRALIERPSAGSSTPIGWQPLALQFALWTSGGMHLSDLTGTAYGDWISSGAQTWAWLDSLQIALLIGGIIAAGGLLPRSWVSPDSARTIVVVVWLLPIVLLLFGARAPAIHYVAPVQPAAALLMGIGVQMLTEHTARWARLIIAALIVMIAVWQSNITIRFADFSATHAVSISPARPLLALAELAQQSIHNGLAEAVIIVADGDNLPWDERIVSIDAALSGVPHRFLNGRNDGMILRPTGGHYVFLPNTEAAFERLCALIGPGLQVTPINVRLSNYPVQTYRYVTVPPFDISHFDVTDDARWAHGLRLRGAQLRRTATTANLAMLFAVDVAPPAGTNVHWFQQLFAGGNAVQQVDSQGVHPFYWRAGDWIVQTVEMPISATQILPTPFVVRIGSYPYPVDGTRSRVTLSYGKVTDSVDVILVP